MVLKALEIVVQVEEEEEVNFLAIFSSPIIIIIMQSVKNYYRTYNHYDRFDPPQCGFSVALCE